MGAWAADTLREIGIQGSETLGRHYALCPQCSHSRKKHASHKTLGYTVYGDRIVCGCNHCGWTDAAFLNGKSKTNGKIDGDIKGNLVAAYDYVDEKGELLFQVCRRSDKQGFPQRVLRDGKWLWKVPPETRRVLYRLPELLAAVAAGELVVLPEGEKDADNLWRLGFAATCEPGGASEPGKKQKWKSEYNEYLRGADVLVLGDNDPPGEARAMHVASQLRGVARRVRVLQMGTLPELAAKVGGDVSNLIEMGWDAERLSALFAGVPDTHHERVVVIERCSDLRDMRFDQLIFTVDDYLPEGFTILGGRPKIGKSWMVLELDYAVATEGSLFLGRKCQHGDVLGLFLEDGKRRMQRRLTAMYGISKPWPERFQYSTSWLRLDQGGMEEIKKWCDSVRDPRLISIDILNQIKQKSAHKNQDLYDRDYEALVALREFGEKHKLTIVGTMHQRKQGADDLLDTINSTLGSAGAADTVLVLARDANGSKYLYGRGRDIEEFKITVTQDEHFRWENLGSQMLKTMSSERARIVEILRRKGTPMSPKEIILELGKTMDNVKPVNIRNLLSKMTKGEQVIQLGDGRYELPDPQEGMPF